MTDTMSEVRNVKEVPRTPVHCGRPMRLLTSDYVGPDGKVKRIHLCDCGAQQPAEPIRA